MSLNSEPPPDKGGTGGLSRPTPNPLIPPYQGDSLDPVGRISQRRNPTSP